MYNHKYFTLLGSFAKILFWCEKHGVELLALVTGWREVRVCRKGALRYLCWTGCLVYLGF